MLESALLGPELGSLSLTQLTLYKQTKQTNKQIKVKVKMGWVPLVPVSSSAVAALIKSRPQGVPT